MEQEVEKIMVFKGWDELPTHLQRIPTYVPAPAEEVMVVAQNGQFITFKTKAGKQGVLSTVYFRTLRQHQLRERLLAKQPRTKAIEAILSKL